MLRALDIENATSDSPSLVLRRIAAFDSYMAMADRPSVTLDNETARQRATALEDPLVRFSARDGRHEREGSVVTHRIRLRAHIEPPEPILLPPSEFDRPRHDVGLARRRAFVISTIVDCHDRPAFTFYRELLDGQTIRRPRRLLNNPHSPRSAALAHRARGIRAWEIDELVVCDGRVLGGGPLPSSPPGAYAFSTQVPSWTSPRLTSRRRLIAATRMESPSWFFSTPRNRTRRGSLATSQAIDRSTIGRQRR